MTTSLNDAFPKGLLRAELFVGVVSAVSASQARLNLSAAEHPSGAHFESGRYGRGEVGELVLIDGQVDLVLARIVDVRVGEPDRWEIDRSRAPGTPYEVSGFAQFLGTVRPDTLRVSAGVANYPRLGDRVYAAPHAFIGRIPHLMEGGGRDQAAVELRIGTVSGKSGAEVVVRPEKLFGRHCAVLGATGGGKSWTVTRLIEECVRYNSKIVLIDATGEYRDLERGVVHYHMGKPVASAASSAGCRMPPSVFEESDFIALFEPSGKVQGPKLRNAIRSLRLARLANEVPGLVTDGIIKKIKARKKPIADAERRFADQIEDPRQPFDVLKLEQQLSQECVKDGSDGQWGEADESSLTWCLPLRTRIAALVRSPAFAPVFGAEGKPFGDALSAFLSRDDQKVLRLCMSGVSYEFRAREYIVNAVGRHILREVSAAA